MHFETCRCPPKIISCLNTYTHGTGFALSDEAEKQIT
jgi:hypothetical protein